MRRLIIVSAAVVSALLLAVTITGVILVNTINRDNEREAYEDCMARYGYGASDPASNIDDQWLSDGVTAAQECSN